VTGDSVVTKGIFTCQGGVVQAIAFEGDPIPGTSGPVFSDDLSDASLSDDGRVAFIDNSSSPVGVFVSAPPPSAAVPTLSEWAMILMAVLLAGFGVMAIHRRRLAGGGLSGRPA
jgi:hypothetical protein